MKTNISRALAVIGLLLFPAVTAPAQVTFTVSGTAGSTALGYTASQAVTFTFVLNDFAPTTPVGSAPTGFFNWNDENSGTDPELWADISGTGLVGTWTRPNGSGATSPNSLLQAGNNGSNDLLWLFATTETAPSASDTGMTVGGVNLFELSFNVAYTGLNFGALGNPNPLPDPTFYFSSLAGTYAVDSITTARVTRGGDLAFVDFTITSLTITAIPEPGTYAAIMGVAVLGLILVRRRRLAAKSLSGLLGVGCVLLALTGAPDASAVQASPQQIEQLQSQLSQMQQQAMKMSDQVAMVSLMKQINAVRTATKSELSVLNTAMLKLNQMVQGYQDQGIQGVPTITIPFLPPVDPIATAPAAQVDKMAELLKAAAAGDVDQVAALVNGGMGYALNDPANARALAAALGNGSPVAVAWIARIIAGQLHWMTPESASILASRISTVISRPDVIAANAADVATAAELASATAAKADVIAFNPAAAAKIAKESAAIAANPAIIAIATVTAREINKNVAVINNTPSVSVILGLTTNPQPLDVSTVSKSS